MTPSRPDTTHMDLWLMADGTTNTQEFRSLWDWEHDPICRDKDSRPDKRLVLAAAGLSHYLPWNEELFKS